MIEIKHPIFGFDWINIEPNGAITRFTKLLIEVIIFFQTSNELEHVHLLLIELKHPIFGFEQSNFGIRT